MLSRFDLFALAGSVGIGAVVYRIVFEQKANSQQRIVNRVETVVDSLQKIKLGFLRRVYGIFTIQLSSTAAIAYLASEHPPFRHIILNYPSLLVLAGVGSVSLWTACFVYQHSYPINLQLLFSGTLCSSYLISFMCASISQTDIGPVGAHAARLIVVSMGTIAASILLPDHPSPLRSIGASLLAVCGASAFSSGLSAEERVQTGVVAWAASSVLMLYSWEMVDRLSPDDAVGACLVLYANTLRILVEMVRKLAAAASRKQARRQRREEEEERYRRALAAGTAAAAEGWFGLW